MMNEPIYLDGELVYPITNDVMFKAVFGQLENRDLLVDLLNTYLQLDIQSVDDIELMAQEKILRYEEDKLFRLDLRVKTSSGKQINIEIQVLNHHDIIERSFFYVTGMYHEQFTRRMAYNRGQEAVGLYILCYNQFHEEKGFLQPYRLMHEQSHNSLKPLIRLVYLEIPKIPDHGADIWSRFFAAEDEAELKRLEKENPMIEKVVNIMKYVSADEEKRYLLEQQMKVRMDEYSRRVTALDEGKAEGKTEGLAEGIEIGRTQERDQLMQRMRRQGFSEEQIRELLD